MRARGRGRGGHVSRRRGRDDTRKIREKVTGKLLALDRSLEPFLPALLSLLDVAVEDPQWERLDPPRRRQRTLDGVKRLLLRESKVQPVVTVFEDLHWIDSETQALLDSLVESLPTARLLLLVNYRPEYQHGWGGKTSYRQLRIDPLPPATAEELLRGLLGDAPELRPGDHEAAPRRSLAARGRSGARSEEHTSELQSLAYLVCRLLLEKKK